MGSGGYRETYGDDVSFVGRDRGISHLRWALGALVVLGASAVMIGAILLLRRRAPVGLVP